MAERLTDRTELTTVTSVLDKIMIVDVSDTTDNAFGTSKQQELRNFFKGQSFQLISGALVYKTFGADDSAIIDVGDWVIYMTQTRLVIGYCITIITSVPADFDNAGKFSKFIDNGPAL